MLDEPMDYLNILVVHRCTLCTPSIRKCWFFYSSRSSIVAISCFFHLECTKKSMQYLMASRFVARLASVEKPCLIVPVTSCKLEMFQFLCTWSFNLRMETAVQEVPLLVCLETIQQLGSLHLSMYTCRQGCHCLRLTDGFDEGCHFSILQVTDLSMVHYSCMRSER